MKKSFFFKSSLVAVAALFMTACSENYDNPFAPTTADLDVTALVSTSGWGQGGFAGAWAAPEVDTSDGRHSGLAEIYHGSNDGIAETGIMLQQTIQVENGDYVVELYANSLYTPNRGFDSDMKAKVAETTPENGLYTLEVRVKDGQLTLGLGKEKAGTNWHTIQIKSLIHKNAPIPDPKDPEPEPEPDLTTLVATDGWGQGGFAGSWAAPEVDTSDGRHSGLAEIYHGSNDGIAETGVMLQQTIQIENGNYVKAKVAETTPENGLYTLEVRVKDGQLTLGLGKEKPGTNWHTIQIKSLKLAE